MKRLSFFLVSGIGLLVVFVFVMNTLIYAETRPYIYSVGEAPHAEVALIPGAPVVNGAPAPIFMDRANAAIALYNAGKVSKILVSGDNSSVLHNEVDPLRRYLLAQGIPDGDIALDHAGFDTYSTMYRARDIFGVSSALVASQSFHLPRAVFIARRLGIEAYGVDADVGHILFSNYLREVFADEKAVFDLLVNRQPKFLGEKIPLGNF